jgi:hypothetical protein
MRIFPVLAVIGVIVYTGSEAWSPSREPVKGAQQDDFEWRGRLAQGQTVHIRGLNGPIEATLASGSEVEVRAVKKEGDRGDADDVTIEVVEHDGGVTICAIYPSRDRDDPNECRANGRGRNNNHRNDTKVMFTIRVPAGVDFVGRTVNGDIEADGLESNVDAATVNGDIEVSTSGAAEARTVNGSVWASLGSTLTEDLEFSTVNGRITVELPSGVSADVHAETVNGGIETDFPLTVKGRWGPREMRGTIGGGGPELSLETVNGSIRLIER